MLQRLRLADPTLGVFQNIFDKQDHTTRKFDLTYQQA
jgi:hypothetical protein